MSEETKVRLENNNTELHYDKYVHRGSMMILRSALSLDDPDMLYNYLKDSPALKDVGFCPEDFGIYHPIIERFKDSSKEELLTTLTDLFIENDRLRRNQF